MAAMAGRVGIELVATRLASGMPDYEFARLILADPTAILLDSGAGGRFGRTSYFALPSEVAVDWRCEERTGDPLNRLRELLDRVRGPADPPPGFWGGYVGYLSYDARQLFEVLPARHPRLTDMPDVHFVRVDAVLPRDEASGDVWLREARVRGGRPSAKNGGARLRQLLSGVSHAAPRRWKSTPGPMMAPNEDAHIQRVLAAQDLLRRGEIYQVNLTVPWSFPRPADPAALYLALRERNPATFGAFFPCGADTILSLSPERFFSLRQGGVRTRPVKGTRPRGRSPSEDHALAAELLASTKDGAELAMIVDVLRNDLSRVSRIGSVEVREPVCLESHATVHHLVAEVESVLAPGQTVVDLLVAATPGGSITGAPRIRAMEVIDDLEEGRRGPYCGTLGWIGFQGDADFNILIRTAYTARDRLQLHAGGGITVLSDPLAEFAEAEAKVRGLWEVIAGRELRRGAAQPSEGEES